MYRSIRDDRFADNPDIEFYTELLADGRTAVRTRYVDRPLTIRPVIQTEKDIYADAAQAVAYCAVMCDTRAFVEYAIQGEPFLERLTEGFRKAGILAWPHRPKTT